MTIDQVLTRIAAGRTDLVHNALSELAQNPDLSVEGATAIQWCAYYGDTTAVRALLAHGAKLAQLGDDFGLAAAAFHGHWQLCQFLLEQGSDANRREPTTGETPLHSALSNDDRDHYDLVVTVLLAHGANPNTPTLPNQPIGAFMRDCRTKGETPLHHAAAFGRAETIQALLAAGADRTTRDVNGDSPLAWASWYRRPADILRLLAYGPHQIHAGYRGLRVNLLGNPT
jgi:ankyrin repeat protein